MTPRTLRRWVRRVEQIEEALNADAALSCAEADADFDVVDGYEQVWETERARVRGTLEWLSTALYRARSTDPQIEKTLSGAIEQIADRAAWYDCGPGSGEASAYAGNVERELRRFLPVR